MSGVSVCSSRLQPAEAGYYKRKRYLLMTGRSYFCSQAGSWRTQRARTPPTNMTPAMTNMAVIKVPAASLTLPMISELAAPPRLPNEFISAMPPAAATLPRNAVGNDQKHGIMLNMPAAAMQSPRWMSHGELTEAAVIQPIAATNADAATCQRRSPVLSECQLTGSIAAIARTYGSAARSPSSNLLTCVNIPARIFG